MYLEERVEQLEALTVDQGKQAELIAKGVAKLTTDTQQGIDELKQGQTALHQEIIRLADLSDGTNERITQLDRKIDLRIDQVNERFDEVDNRFIEVDARFAQVDARFDQIDTRFDGVDARFVEVNARFDGVDARFVEVDARFDGVDSRFDGVDTRFDGVDSRFDGVGARFDRVDANQIEFHQEITDMRQEIAGLKAGQELILQILREKLQ